MLKAGVSLLLLLAALLACDGAYAADSELPLIHLNTSYTVEETGEPVTSSFMSLALPRSADEAARSYEWAAREMKNHPELDYTVVAFHYEGEPVDPRLYERLPKDVRVKAWPVKKGTFKNLKHNLKSRLQGLKNKARRAKEGSALWRKWRVIKEGSLLWAETKFDRFLNNEPVYNTTFALLRGVGGYSVFGGSLVAGGVPKGLAALTSIYPTALSMGLQFKADWWTNLLGRLNPLNKTLVWGATDYLYLVPPAVLLTYFGFPPVEGGMMAIANDLNVTVVQSIIAQAPWEFAISDKKKYEIRHGRSEDRKMYEFKASIKVLGISLASIVGAALKLTSDPAAHQIGEFVLMGLGATGIYQYLRVNWDHNRHIHDKVNAFLAKFKASTKLKTMHCVQVLNSAFHH